MKARPHARLQQCHHACIQPRIHSSLGYLTHATYEQQWHQQPALKLLAPTLGGPEWCSVLGVTAFRSVRLP